MHLNTVFTRSFQSTENQLINAYNGSYYAFGNPIINVNSFGSLGFLLN